jgi:hypothetical protein
LRDPTEDEIATHERLLKLVQLHPTTVGDFQAAIAPGKPLRERPGMNVRVGNHIAPEGGPNIIRRLQRILSNANDASRSPWSVHIAFETLHRGEATKALYARLEACGVQGFLAVQLFRACKSSERAKVYRGGNRQGSYRRQAYDRKQWSLRRSRSRPGLSGEWDGRPGQSASRVCVWVARILGSVEVSADMARSADQHLASL